MEESPVWPQPTHAESLPCINPAVCLPSSCSGWAVVKCWAGFDSSKWKLVFPSRNSFLFQWNCCCQGETIILLCSQTKWNHSAPRAVGKHPSLNLLSLLKTQPVLSPQPCLSHEGLTATSLPGEGFLWASLPLLEPNLALLMAFANWWNPGL